MKKLNNYFPIENDRIKVENLASRRSGEPVKNQFCIFNAIKGYRLFQSYETLCIRWDFFHRVLTIYPAAFDYSMTTSKYSKVFLEDYCGFTPEEVEEVKKLAKSEDFGNDCPLCIQK